jgi:serine/threonine protein kinase
MTSPTHEPLDGTIRTQLSSKGWYLPSDAKPIAQGGGGKVYLCYRSQLIEAFTNLAQAPDAAAILIQEIHDRLVLHRDGIGILKVPLKTSGRFTREIAAMRAVESKHIAPIFDYDDSSDGPRWFVMRYYPNGSLFESLPDYRGQPVKVFRKLLPVVDALAELHKKNLYHRDLKPKNIFANFNDDWVIGDLGIVYDATDDATRTAGELDQSRDWIPPWHVRDGSYTPQHDLYMLAKVAFYMILGEKLLQSHWLQEDSFNLVQRFPGISGIERVQAFFEEHIVLRQAEFPSQDAASFKGAVSEILEHLLAPRVAHLLFSSVATDARSTSSPSLETYLHKMPLYISFPCMRIFGRLNVQHYDNGRSSTTQFVVINMDGQIIHRSNELNFSGSPSPWGIEVTLNLDAPLQPGWYRFSFTQALAVVVHGIVLYAE